MSEENKKLVKEIQEMLSEIVLKLKDVKKIAIDRDNYDYQPRVGGNEYIEDEEGNEIKNPNYGTIEERFLSSTRELCKMMSKRSDTSYILEQYYNSNC